MRFLGLLLALLVSACAIKELTEEEKYERAARDAERLDKFYEYEAACKAVGGIIIIKRFFPPKKTFGRKLPPPEIGDRYYCVK